MQFHLELEILSCTLPEACSKSPGKSSLKTCRNQHACPQAAAQFKPTSASSSGGPLRVASLLCHNQCTSFLPTHHRNKYELQYFPSVIVLLIILPKHSKKTTSLGNVTNPFLTLPVSLRVGDLSISLITLFFVSKNYLIQLVGMFCPKLRITHLISLWTLCCSSFLCHPQCP